MRSVLVASLLLLATASVAEARTFRVNQVPNGSAFECALCHVSSRGGGPKTGFGSQVEATLEGDPLGAGVDWAAICEQDGDSDGYSNGRELGDPDCTWTAGDPDPAGDFYNPASRDDSPCGDGVLENPPEECDGEAMPDVTCEDLGWGPGELTCNSICRINESGCEGFEIPNNANNTPANNETNNATGTNNATETNNAVGSNNETGTNNMTSGGDPVEVIDDEEGGCTTANSPAPQRDPALLILVLGMLLVSRTSVRASDAGSSER